MLLLGACTTPGEYRLAETDPLEKVNRGVWGVNMAADKVIIKPATQVYRVAAPKPVRRGVSNAFANLGEPWSLVNNTLQGKPKRAVRNLGRFLVNSTIGIGGLFDQASKMGMRPAAEDFGQTLATWGVNGGPYLVLPLLGPSTLRDGIGSGVAAYADPVKVAINEAHVNVWYKRAYLGAYILSARSDLIETGGDTFLKTSLDPYAAARSAYLQVRRAQIRDEDDVVPASAIMPAVGSGAQPAAPGGTAAPLPGDDAPSPSPGGALTPSAAPLPGDDTPNPPSTAAPLPGDDAPTAPPHPQT